MSPTLNIVTEISSCRLCDSAKLENVFNFGKTALANNYLTSNDIDQIKNGNKLEELFDLSYSLCMECGGLQLDQIIDPNKIFKTYLYASSAGGNLLNYFNCYVNDLVKNFGLNSESLVIEPGSNDGVMLRSFKQHRIKAVGVDPATNLAETAISNGFNIINKYFDVDAANYIVNQHGKADCITFNNIAAHINDVKTFFGCVKKCLKQTGFFCFENSYLHSMLEGKYVDILYHEHVMEYGVKPLKIFLESIGLEIFDVYKTSPHGGSIRVFGQFKNGARKISDNVNKFIKIENDSKIYDLNTYRNVVKDIRVIRHKLLDILNSTGRPIAAYGYPAKATTLCNLLGIGDSFNYVVEDSELKIGKFTPQFHKLIVNIDTFKHETPNSTLILAWNYADLIQTKNSWYQGRWIHPFKLN